MAVKKTFNFIPRDIHIYFLHRISFGITPLSFWCWSLMIFKHVSEELYLYHISIGCQDVIFKMERWSPKCTYCMYYQCYLCNFLCVIGQSRVSNSECVSGTVCVIMPVCTGGVRNVVVYRWWCGNRSPFWERQCVSSQGETGSNKVLGAREERGRGRGGTGP